MSLVLQHHSFIPISHCFSAVVQVQIEHQWWNGHRSGLQTPNHSQWWVFSFLGLYFFVLKLFVSHANVYCFYLQRKLCTTQKSIVRGSPGLRGAHDPEVKRAHDAEPLTFTWSSWSNGRLTLGVDCVVGGGCCSKVIWGPRADGRWPDRPRWCYFTTVTEKSPNRMIASTIKHWFMHHWSISWRSKSNRTLSFPHVDWSSVKNERKCKFKPLPHREWRQENKPAVHTSSSQRVSHCFLIKPKTWISPISG